MTAFTAAALFVALSTVAGAALHTPTDREGRPVTRTRRSLWGDVRSLFGVSYS